MSYDRPRREGDYAEEDTCMSYDRPRREGDYAKGLWCDTRTVGEVTGELLHELATLCRVRGARDREILYI